MTTKRFFNLLVTVVLSLTLGLSPVSTAWAAEAESDLAVAENAEYVEGDAEDLVDEVEFATETHAEDFAVEEEATTAEDQAGAIEHYWWKYGWDSTSHLLICACGVSNCSLAGTDSRGAHNFSDWSVLEEPTETEAGRKTRSCWCGYSEYVTIPALAGDGSDKEDQGNDGKDDGQDDNKQDDQTDNSQTDDDKKNDQTDDKKDDQTEDKKDDDSSKTDEGNKDNTGTTENNGSSTETKPTEKPTEKPEEKPTEKPEDKGDQANGNNQNSNNGSQNNNSNSSTSSNNTGGSSTGTNNQQPVTTTTPTGTPATSATTPTGTPTQTPATSTTDPTQTTAPTTSTEAPAASETPTGTPATTQTAVTVTPGAITNNITVVTNVTVEQEKVNRVTINKSKTVKVGKKVALQAKYTGFSKKNFTWKSANKKYVTVNKNGVIKAKKAGRGKTVKVTATAKKRSGNTVTVVKIVYKIKIKK